MKTLFHNGIITAAAQPTATSLVIEDDRIIYVGSEQDAPAADKQVNLAGRRVLPGFIDGYFPTHLPSPYLPT
jgi:predicted amidohydrolase YtcJ